MLDYGDCCHVVFADVGFSSGGSVFWYDGDLFRRSLDKPNVHLDSAVSIPAPVDDYIWFAADQSGGGDDLDGKGLANGLEFLAGTSPHQDDREVLNMASSKLGKLRSS
jgi:hypothetical protein